MDLKLIKKQTVASFPKSIRAMSYNIRMAPNHEDDATENAWEHRLPKVRMIIEQYKPDIIGLQEVSLFQMNSLHISPYKMLGKYPSKPQESGLGILYLPQKLLLISNLHTIWLNEAQANSKASSWDGSSFERFVIYAKFKNLIDDTEFWFLTTHFDHMGQIARLESAKIVMDLADSLEAPAIVTGDFNTFPQLGGVELYHLLNTRSDLIRDSATMTDNIFGVKGSWMGWDYDPYKQRNGTCKYDYIFTHNNIKVLQHGIIDDRVWDNNFQKELYPSDHRPVISDLRFKN